MSRFFCNKFASAAGLNVGAISANVDCKEWPFLRFKVALEEIEVWGLIRSYFVVGGF